MKVAVLLISRQNLPNLLFIKEFKGFDRFVFLTTGAMRKSGQMEALIYAAKINGRDVSEIEVDPENMQTTYEILQRSNWSATNEYFVNLTGGTKMMALATHLFFSKLPASRMYYMPIHAPYLLELAPSSNQIPLDKSVSLIEYLDCHGARIIESNKNWKSKTDEASVAMEHLQNNQNPYFLRINVPNPTPEEKRFFDGEWLEIWLAGVIHSWLGIPEKNILSGVKLSKRNVSNNSYYEYDIMFMRNNRLFVGECKYFRGQNFRLHKIHKELFKFASMNNQLGLSSKPFIVIGNQVTDAQQIFDLEDHCQMLGLPYPATKSDLSSKSSFLKYLETI